MSADQRTTTASPSSSSAGSPPRTGGTRAYLTIFGAPPSPVSVAVLELGLGQRLGRAALALGVCWALALVSVFIVLAHFILVPGFLVAGLVLGSLRFRTTRIVTKVHGACPRCGAEQDFKPPSWGRTIDCLRCKNQLRLAGLDGAEPASAGGTGSSQGSGG